MSFHFVIDIREAKLLDVYGSKQDGILTVKPEYQKYVKFGKLDAGDVCFYDSNGLPVVLIERKEVCDLSSCIDSGSYTEQKMRMLKYKEENPSVKLVYLIEKFTLTNNLTHIVNPNAPTKQLKTIEVLLSAIVSTMLRDNFFTMTTQSFEGTVAFIERIYKKWPSYKLNSDVKTETDGTKEYLKNIKVSKKDNLTPSNWFVRSLSHIPGVSVDKASAIQLVYPTFTNLIDQYKIMTDEKSRENMLKDTICGTRKLGPVCSKRIYNYVCSSNVCSTNNDNNDNNDVINE
jgi:ERCC4-type nuclease